VSEDSPLVRQLAGESDKVIETSCAWVFLQGERALKVKKPVDYGFLDYSTLEKRRWALMRELEFNRAAAPDIYRSVHAITERGGRYQVGAPGQAVEYALEMRRFDDTAVLAERPWAVDADLAERLGRTIARFHADAPLLASGGLKAIAYTVGSNAEVMRGIGEARLGAGLEPALTATAEALERMRPLLQQREAEGFSRRCHGDLHLGNVLLEDGDPILFDCIEFNDTLSDLDVLYDLAFLLMDLHFRRRTDAANRVLNAYLDEAARHFAPTLWAGLALLPLTQAVRAGVRTHVSAHAGDDEAARRYLAAAMAPLEPQPPRLMAIGGPSGSGKTTLARLVAPAMGAAPGAVILRTDELRKRLAGAAHDQPLPAAAYDQRTTRRTYDLLLTEARAILNAGWSVVLDATFLDPALRAEASALADEVAVPFEGVWLSGSAEVMAQRLRTRRGDASDADVAVLHEQFAALQPPSDWRSFDAADLELAAAALHET
jgi:aminoglycoside phosphotransferase family enzyme/predicted kinase